ncbi:MAG TPA: rod shape-determining protein MreC [Streptosporangiaceae bacterium]|nr:rod shape-determining protein MreC [Streptosporangiaceae bacterium]
MRDTGRTRLALSLALIVALALIAVDYENGSSGVVRGVRGTAGSVFGGIERSVSIVTSPIGRFVGGGLSGSDASVQTAALRRRLAVLRAELSEARLSKADSQQLKRLLALAGAGSYRVVAASVIAFGQGYQQTIALNVGSSDGVRAQQTVLNGDGLVGKVISVSKGTCTVLLATDASSVVGIRLAPGGEVGWVTGQGSSRTGPGLLKLSVLDPAAVLRPGEQLVTAASVKDRPFVPGVPVGVISAVRNKAGALTAQAFVRPYVSFGTLDVVAVVIAPPKRNPRFSVLPPKPAPKPPPAPSVSPPAPASPTPSGAPPRQGH